MSHLSRSSRAATLMFSVLSLAFTTGCMSFNPRSLRTMEAALRHSNPELDIASSVKFGVGALTLDFVDFAFVHDRRIDLSKISRADIGIYELNGTLGFDTFTMPEQLTSDGGCPRRDVILRIREDDEQVELVACIRAAKVTGLAMVVLDPAEIVIMNIHGDFEALISSLVRSSINTPSRESQADDGSETRAAAVVAALE